MQCKFIASAALAACIVAPATARVTEINVAAVEPFADGAMYGTTGAYERVRGTFKGELDPADARNKVIVNLDKAPRNARGLVEYEADFFLLRPADAARGNHKIIYDVTTIRKPPMTRGPGFFSAGAIRWRGAAGIPKRHARTTAWR